MDDVAKLIELGKLGEAARALERLTAGEPADVELMRLRLAVASQELDPTLALQKVVALLRERPRHAGALRLYRELSALQYEAGRSCLSYSHPPPPSHG